MTVISEQDRSALAAAFEGQLLKELPGVVGDAAPWLDLLDSVGVLDLMQLHGEVGWWQAVGELERVAGRYGVHTPLGALAAFGSLQKALGEAALNIPQKSAPGVPILLGLREFVSSGSVELTTEPVVSGWDARLANYVLLPLRTDKGGAAVHGTSLDPESVDPVHGAWVQISTSDLVELWSGPEEELSQAVDAAVAAGQLLTSFNQLGGVQFCLEKAQKHALERTQFGRPIGSFQAIKHRLARCYLAQTALTAVTACHAAQLGLQEAQAAEGINASASYVSEAYIDVVEHTVQILGGVGTTWEVGLQNYLSHAWRTRKQVLTPVVSRALGLQRLRREARSSR